MSTTQFVLTDAGWTIYTGANQVLMEVGVEDATVTVTMSPQQAVRIAGALTTAAQQLLPTPPASQA